MLNKRKEIAFAAGFGGVWGFGLPFSMLNLTPQVKETPSILRCNVLIIVIDFFFVQAFFSGLTVAPLSPFLHPSGPGQTWGLGWPAT